MKHKYEISINWSLKVTCKWEILAITKRLPSEFSAIRSLLYLNLFCEFYWSSRPIGVGSLYKSLVRCTNCGQGVTGSLQKGSHLVVAGTLITMAWLSTAKLIKTQTSEVGEVDLARGGRPSGFIVALDMPCRRLRAIGREWFDHNNMYWDWGFLFI